MTSHAQNTTKDGAVLSCNREKFMRKEFISEDEAATLEEAEKIAPWAAEIIEVEGGWQAFESVTDADTWKAQA